MKLPNPGSVAHNHAVTMDLGTPEPLIGATVTSSIHHILWCCWQRLPLKLEITLEQPFFMPRKLDYMSKEDHSHITMVSTWAAELYLDKINRLLLVTEQEDKGGERGELPSF